MKDQETKPNNCTDFQIHAYELAPDGEITENEKKEFEEESSPEEDEVTKLSILTWLGSCGIFTAYALRVCMSVTMVAMVYQPPKVRESGVACLELLEPHVLSTNSTDMDNSHLGEFNWDVGTQGIILGAFFYGYIITQIPGGILAEKYGAKWLLGIGILLASIFALLTPFAARWSVEALITVRIIQGLGEGVTFPAMNAMIGRWVPKMKRSTISTIIYCGSPLGTVVSLFLSGIISDSKALGGWPSVFYFFGGFGCLWFVFWTVFIPESPEVQPQVSQRELGRIRQGQSPDQRRNGPIPWKSILTSPAVWALVITHFGYNWGFYTLLTELPTYLSNILHFDLRNNGALAAFPYLVQAVFAFTGSILADRLRASGRVRITTIRKIFNSLAFYGAGLVFLMATFVGCNPVTVVVLLTFSVGLNGLMYSGFNVTHVDMSPDFAGTLMGLTNCIANTAGFFAPAYVGWMIQHGQTVKNWNLIFFTTAFVYFITGTIYNIFCSAELQPWGIAKPATANEAPNSRRTSKGETNPNQAEP